jgi:hypothetical protein
MDERFVSGLLDTITTTYKKLGVGGRGRDTRRGRMEVHSEAKVIGWRNIVKSDGRPKRQVFYTSRAT